MTFNGYRGFFCRDDYILELVVMDVQLWEHTKKSTLYMLTCTNMLTWFDGILIISQLQCLKSPHYLEGLYIVIFQECEVESSCIFSNVNLIVGNRSGQTTGTSS